MPKVPSGPVRIIKSDKKSSRHSEWLKWMCCVSGIRERYKTKEDDDPFDFNEAASVSILASAAFAKGDYALAEYVSTKRTQTDLRHKSNGRDDLYVVLNDEGWVFECKQLFRPTPSLITSKFKAAYDCAKQTDSIHGERGVATLIIYITDFYLDRVEKYAENILNFCALEDKVQFAVSLDAGPKLESRCFLLFSDPVEL